jgi:hypothetical protein
VLDSLISGVDSTQQDAERMYDGTICVNRIQKQVSNLYSY